MKKLQEQHCENIRVLCESYQQKIKELEEKIQKLQRTFFEKETSLRNEIVGYLNDYDVVAYLEKVQVKYDSWLKAKIFEMLGEIRTEIIMKFSKAKELVELTKK